MGIVTRPFRPRPPIPFFVIPGPSVYDGPSQPVPTPTTGVLFSSQHRKAEIPSHQLARRGGYLHQWLWHWMYLLPGAYVPSPPNLGVAEVSKIPSSIDVAHQGTSVVMSPRNGGKRSALTEVVPPTTITLTSPSKPPPSGCAAKEPIPVARRRASFGELRPHCLAPTAEVTFVDVTRLWRQGSSNLNEGHVEKVSLP